jgi:hypothetical protein
VCTPCDDGGSGSGGAVVCALGATAPVPAALYSASNNGDNVYPPVSGLLIASDALRNLGIVIGIVVGAGLLCCAVALAVLNACCSSTQRKRCLRRADILWAAKHPTYINKPIVMRRTALGGVLTVLYLFVLSVIVGFCLAYFFLTRHSLVRVTVIIIIIIMITQTTQTTMTNNQTTRAFSCTLAYCM